MRAAFLALALLALPAAAEDRSGTALTIRAEPVELPPASLHRRAALVGGWVLTGDNAGFGGLSALLVEAAEVTMASDNGFWVFARLQPEAEQPLADARLRPMTDASGATLTGSDGDAEGLARQGGEIRLSLERDHRILTLRDRVLAHPVRPDGTGDLPNNDGMEALATLPDGSLIAIAEDQRPEGFPWWILRPDGGVERGMLPARSHHRVTGADVAGGRLYVLQRFWSPATGVSARVIDYPLDAAGHPVPAHAAELAAWESESGIDNMEGIAAVPDGKGGVTLWLLSDDNFNPPQRTLLVRLQVEAAR